MDPDRSRASPAQSRTDRPPNVCICTGGANRSATSWCDKCGRTTSWLDIVSSALTQVHRKQLIAKVALGEQKFVNTEAPRAIAGVRCHQCGNAIESLRSFRCHNWAYAVGDLARIVERVGGRA